MEQCSGEDPSRRGRQEDRHLVKRGLEAEGFTVEVAFDGADGLWLATEGSFDLIVLDIMLPGRNGYQICADLREAGDWTPILMLTAKDGDLDEAEALDTGADDYLTKPFSFAVLVARIRALLRRATGRNPHPVEAGDLRIDPGQRRVWRGDVEIELTSRQFDVLEFLIRRAGQVLSKTEILDGVWEYEFEGDPNIVEVYIRRLRTRIDEPFDRHCDRDAPRRRLPAAGRRRLGNASPLHPFPHHRPGVGGGRCGAGRRRGGPGPAAANGLINEPGSDPDPARRRHRRPDRRREPPRGVGRRQPTRVSPSW